MSSLPLVVVATSRFWLARRGGGGGATCAAEEQKEEEENEQDEQEEEEEEAKAAGEGGWRREMWPFLLSKVSSKLFFLSKGLALCLAPSHPRSIYRAFLPRVRLPLYLTHSAHSLSSLKVSEPK